MGRGRPSLIFPLDLPEAIGACKLVWRDGDELHVAVPAPRVEAAAGPAQATVDLGEMHQAAVTTTTGAALLISGRGSARSHGGTTGHWATSLRNARAASKARAAPGNCTPPAAR